jgi:hypothetical protein
MQCPPDMAATFLRKWRDESTLLLVSLRDDVRFSISTSGIVLDFDMAAGLVVSLVTLRPASDRGVEVSSGTGEIVAVLNDASFEYVDPREASPGVREASESITVCLLTIKMPNANAPDLLLTLTELKEQGFIRFAQAQH